MSIFLSLPISVGFTGAPPWAVSAPDLAVGTLAWVQTKGNRRSPAARARARRGTNENVWVEPVLLLLQDNWTCPRNARTVLTSK